MKTICATILTLCAVTSAVHAQQRAAAPAAGAGRLSAQSTYEALPRSANCTHGYRTTGVRYTVVGSGYSEGNPPHLVLEEKTSIEQCENLEGPTSAEVSVVARPAMHPEARPVWIVRRRGEAGGVAEEYSDHPLYRITEYGCCGSENLDTYYSLATGRAVFTADHPLLSLDAAPFGTGLVAVHDAEAADAPPGAANDRTLIAVIAFAGASGTAQRVMLRGTTNDFRVAKLELVARGPAGQQKHAQALGINDELTARWSVAVAIELEGMSEGAAAGRVEIPIENGRLAVEKARVPAPFRVVAAAPR